MCQGGTQGAIDYTDNNLFKGIPLVVGVDDGKRRVIVLAGCLTHDIIGLLSTRPSKGLEKHSNPACPPLLRGTYLTSILRSPVIHSLSSGLIIHTAVLPICFPVK